MLLHYPLMCKGKQVAELFTKVVATTKCFDQHLKEVKVIECSKGRMLTEFKVGSQHLNQRGTLHGGFIAHLVDAISTYALTANDHIDTRGLSIDLSIRTYKVCVDAAETHGIICYLYGKYFRSKSYMSAAKEGDNVQVEAVTRKTGKKIVFLEVEVRNKDKNIVLATGRHTKYIGI